jgi:hypothetical protein
MFNFSKQYTTIPQDILKARRFDIIDSCFDKKIGKRKCYYAKTNTLPILMHQMRISTTQVSSLMLMSKKLEIREKKCEN